MTRPIRFLLGTACVLLAVAAADPSPAQDQAPDWSLEGVAGETVAFRASLAEGPVVVSFWATWCRPCLKELPNLDRLAGEYAGRVSFLAVNTDNSKAVAKVAPYVRARGFEYLHVLLDTGGEVQQQLQVDILPFLILYDADGREVYRHVGYKEGDEEELQREIDVLLAQAEANGGVEREKPAWAEAVTATDRLEYSYETDTRREIFDNWLDVSYRFGGFRTGVMLKSSAPSEEGERTNRIEHRFFEYAAGDVSVRAGHFYGIFGRGLIFNAYEDRTVRVDTRLDGLTATVERGPIRGTVFSGTPAAQPVDVRATDWEYASPWGIRIGVTGLTYRPDLPAADDGSVHRDWASGVRLRQNFAFGDYYLETAWTEQRNALEDRFDAGSALYGNLNLYHGPLSVSWETSDYDRFEIVPRADGIVALNRPPALAREFTWTLLNRAPHVLNAADERGNNLDVMVSDLGGWSLLGSGAHLESHAGRTVYELLYGGFEKDRLGSFRLKGGFGYQDSEGLRQTVLGEVTWFAAPSRSVILQAEHQHVRAGGGPGFDLGAYDQQWFKLEYETAPRWAFAAILETNNKFPEQRQPDERPGPFPAGQITYTIPRGGNLNLWAGKRQAGYLCSGGVCKFEPAFEGVELFGVFRY